MIKHSISIHVPREGDDILPRSTSGPLIHFNPRPPRGGRPNNSLIGLPEQAFQSTSPARGTTPSPIACAGV